LLSNLNIEANQLYLVCRGTKSKSGLISNEFNLSKNNISHVGIGYMKDSLLYVAHISNEKQRGKTGLTIDKAYNYILDSEVYHFSLWKINLTYSEFIKAIKVIDDLKKDSIHFDFDFRLDNGNSRSEERRVGKECGYRWTRGDGKKNVQDCKRQA